jgi:hypothetical protein
MWMIGRSQRVEGKKYRPIVRKILENRHLHVFGMQHSNEMQIWSGTNEEPWSMMGSNDYKRLL